MNVVFAGGGTGGHVYPGLAVARALRDLRPDVNLLYIGIRGRVDEQIVPREGIPFRAISAGQLRVGSPFVFARNVARLTLGCAQSLRILFAFKADAVFATGGYASVPVGIAARLLRRPLIVYLPDVTPGWAVRLLSRLSTRMTTTSERALAYLPQARTSVVGYPVRGDFWSLDRAAARDRLGLPRDEQVLLVTGASLGARAINQAVWEQLTPLLDRCVVFHVTGPADEAAAIERQAQLPPPMRERYVVRGFLDDMPAALIAADLAVSRAGASSLGELPAAGVPAILVPGEYEGWSQAPNAEYLRDTGAAVMLRNAELHQLAGAVCQLLDDPAALERMRSAMRSLARPDAARDIAQILLEAAA